MEDLVSRESIRKNIKQRLMETALNTCGEEITMDEACIDICDNRIDTWINEVSPINDTEILEQNEEIFKQFKKKAFLESEDVLGNEMVDSYMVTDYLAELLGVEND